MDRLKNYEKLSYDSNIIIYYCLKTKETRVIELTDKTHELTRFLVNNKSFITVPNFIMNEISKIDIPKMISKMIKERSLTCIPKDSNYSFQFTLAMKLEKNLKKMQANDWFIIEMYYPSKDIFEAIEDFFNSLEDHPQIEEYLKSKHKNSPVPSFEDMALIAFSKEKNCPVITNDKDLTFFAKELLEKNISGEIFALQDLDIYNN